MDQSLLFNPLLVNSLGHSAGIVIFGIFLYLMVQDRSARRLRGGMKSMLAATLALLWNLASLLVLAAGWWHGDSQTTARLTFLRD